MLLQQLPDKGRESSPAGDRKWIPSEFSSALYLHTYKQLQKEWVHHNMGMAVCKGWSHLSKAKQGVNCMDQSCSENIPWASLLSHGWGRTQGNASPYREGTLKTRCTPHISLPRWRVGKWRIFCTALRQQLQSVTHKCLGMHPRRAQATAAAVPERVQEQILTSLSWEPAGRQPPPLSCWQITCRCTQQQPPCSLCSTKTLLFWMGRAKRSWKKEHSFMKKDK